MQLAFGCKSSAGDSPRDLSQLTGSGCPHTRTRTAPPGEDGIANQQGQHSRVLSCMFV